MQDTSKLNRRNRSSRSRPSLAAFAGSGYEPPVSREVSESNTLPASISRNSSVLKELQDDPFDLGIASQLLGEDSPLKDPKASVRTQHRSMRTTRSFPFNVDGEQTIGRSTVNSSYYPSTNTMSRSQTVSSAWSGMSHRLFAESISGTVTERNTDIFTKQFDKLARKHGIQPFPERHGEEPGTVSVSSTSQDRTPEEANTPPLPGNKLWNKLMRRTSVTIDVSKHHGNMKLSLSRRRGSSISELAAIGRGKKDTLKGMHLEDFVRLGGVTPFVLPPELTPGDILIPTCVHAAAAFILNYGLKTPGLFRVPGNPTTTYALYDYYQKQFEENNNEPVVQTISLAKLPGHIRYNVHDVTHLLKKLLYCLPGGLLGSPAVFQALYNIHSFVFPDPSLGDHISSKVKPRMIALALASINLHSRISLICAVFGLLRAVSLASDFDMEPRLRDPHETFTAVREDALSIIFGPLLLGDKSDQILVSESEDGGGSLVPPKIVPTANATPKLSKYTNRHSSAYTKMQMEKTKRAALVCEMLINGWEDICYQLRKIDALGITAKSYDLQATGPVTSLEAVTEPAPKVGVDTYSKSQERNSSMPSFRGFGTSSLRKKGKAPKRGRIPFEFGSMRQHGSQTPTPAPPQAPLPSKPPVDDLMRFSTHNSLEKDDDIFSTPIATPVAPKNMSPVPEVSPQSLESSPNWRIIAPDTPIRNKKGTHRHSVPATITRSSSVTIQAEDNEEIVSRRASRESSRASSPGLEIAAQAATRFRLAFFSDEPIVRETSLESPEELRPIKPTKEERKPSELRSSAPKLGAEIPELSFTPKTSKLFDPSEFSLDDTTPKPLNIKNKTKPKVVPAFSIFEDKPLIEPPPASPTLTLTRPNSKVDVKLTSKIPTQNSPMRTTVPRSPTRPESPVRIQNAPLQPATPNRRPRASTESDIEDRSIWRSADSPSPGKKAPRNNSALYAEIRRLQKLVEVKTEEVNAARKELDILHNRAGAGALNQILRDAQEETKIWKNRAEWAEKQLRNMAPIEQQQKSIETSVIGRGRYSLG